MSRNPEGADPPDGVGEDRADDDGPVGSGHDPSLDPLGLAGTQLSQYTIEGYLGGGGMGVVYRARDNKLDRLVALKFLPALQSHDDDARERFFVEARAASALDHPNICTVYEIGETEKGEVFIAMAFYSGETLKPIIARGPLALGVALDYAIQIARGLARAHAAGIIHRDIKPANVLVTADGVAKILDFGTAKVGDLDLTRTGGVVGTLRYMSPEQLEGDSIDARTDNWSLGVLLYEMLAGVSPFKGTTAPAAIYSAMIEQPLPLSEHRVSVPGPIEALIQQCLQKDRGARFESAEELAAALERAAVDAEVLSETSIRRRRPNQAKSWRMVSLAAAAGVGVVLLLAGSWVQGFWSSGSGSERMYVAVLPFTSSAPDDAVMAAGLTYSLTGMIAELGTAADSLWVVPSSEIAGENIRTATQARKFFPVNSVLEGNLSRLQDTQEVVLNLVDATSDVPTLVSSVILPSPADDTFQERARSTLSEMLGVTVRSSATSPTANPRAYPYYIQARGYLLRLFDETALGDAANLFSLAISEDPEFALAHAGLCEALWEQYRETSDPALAARAIESCDRAAAFAADDPSVLVTLGSLFLQTGEHTKAEQTLLSALESDPESADGHRWLGRVYERAANYDKAAAEYLRSIELRPDVWIYRSDYAVMLVYTGQLAEAGDQYERVIQLSPDNYSGYNGLGIVRLFQGDKEGAERHFRIGLTRQESPVAYRNLAYIRLRSRDYAGAVAEAERAVAIQEGDWYAWKWMGMAHYQAGSAAEAEVALRRVMGYASTRLGINPREADALSAMATVHGLLGEEEEARIYLERLNAEIIPWPYIHHHTSQTYLLLGERELALAAIERALDGDYHPSAIDDDVFLDDIREDPAYVLLRARYEPPPG